jgi:hypothetical protein
MNLTHKKKKILGKSNYHLHAIRTNKCHKSKELFLPQIGKGDNFRRFNSVEEMRSNRVREEGKKRQVGRY